MIKVTLSNLFEDRVGVDARVSFLTFVNGKCCPTQVKEVRAVDLSSFCALILVALEVARQRPIDAEGKIRENEEGERTNDVPPIRSQVECYYCIVCSLSTCKLPPSIYSVTSDTVEFDFVTKTSMSSRTCSNPP